MEVPLGMMRLGVWLRRERRRRSVQLSGGVLGRSRAHPGGGRGAVSSSAVERGGRSVRLSQDRIRGGAGSTGGVMGLIVRFSRG